MRLIEVMAPGKQWSCLLVFEDPARLRLKILLPENSAWNKMMAIGCDFDTLRIGWNCLCLIAV
jgi:hypothetical protein